MQTDDIAVILGNVDMFGGLNPKALKSLARAGHVVDVPAGAEVVHAGDPVGGFRAFSPDGAEMHVILRGTATVHLNGQVVGNLSADDYFGELALIDGRPRSADVVAGSSGRGRHVFRSRRPRSVGRESCLAPCTTIFRTHGLGASSAAAVPARRRARSAARGATAARRYRPEA